jgi:hypothetical protein
MDGTTVEKEFWLDGKCQVDNTITGDNCMGNDATLTKTGVLTASITCDSSEYECKATKPITLTDTCNPLTQDCRDVCCRAKKCSDDFQNNASCEPKGRLNSGAQSTTCTNGNNCEYDTCCIRTLTVQACGVNGAASTASTQIVTNTGETFSRTFNAKNKKFVIDLALDTPVTSVMLTHASTQDVCI